MTRHKPGRAGRHMLSAIGSTGPNQRIFTADELGRRMQARRQERVVNPWLHTTDGFHKLAAAFGLLAFVVIAVIGGFTAKVSSGSVQDRINSVQGQVDRLGGRKQVLTTDLSRFNDQIASIAGRLAHLRTSEAKVQSQLDTEQAHLMQIQRELAQERIRYARLKRKLVRTTERLSGRLLAIFREDEPDMVTVVLNSQGFSDMLHNVEYMNRITDADGDLIVEVRGLKSESKRKERHLNTLEQQVQATVSSIRAKRNAVASKRQQVEQRVNELAAARAARRAALSSINDQEKHLEGNLASLKKAEAAATVQINQTATSGPPSPVPNGPVRQGSGRLSWPVNGPVVSGFGPRVSPGPGASTYHEGIDISVPTGTPIHAAAAGKVTSAGAQSGYGNVVIISHSGGLSTLYAHQSRIAASVGSSVSQGQTIGYSGCTGTCFGPHLHFGVYVGGSAVDPMGYL